MLTAAQICLLASQEAKGGTGMVAIAGQYLNLVLQDLVLNRDLKVNRVTQSVTVATGTNGPFALESDYLRTYDMFYPLQGPNGMTQFLVPITMEQYDAEFKATQTANYPYEFATDLSTQAQTPAPTLPTIITDIRVALPSGGYLTPPSVIFGTTSGSGASALGRLGAIGAKAIAGFTGLVEGQRLTVVGGIFDRPCILEIMFGGLVLGVVDPGSYSSIPGNPSVVPGNFTQTGGASTINTVDANGQPTNLHPLMIWGLADPVLVSGGVNYLPGDLAFPQGGVSGVPPNVDGTYAITIAPATGGSAGNFFIYPQSNGQLVITHRYMRNQPDIVTPETSSVVPWFPYQDYLVKMTAARMMGATGDDRQSAYLAECENMLRPHLIMSGDEQQTVQAVRLDPRTFKSNRGLRPVKTNPY